jgi:hypothetical protein
VIFLPRVCIPFPFPHACSVSSDYHPETEEITYTSEVLRKLRFRLFNEFVSAEVAIECCVQVWKLIMFLHSVTVSLLGPKNVNVINIWLYVLLLAFLCTPVSTRVSRL